jgi:hypothetical protein
VLLTCIFGYSAFGQPFFAPIGIGEYS